jgi:hypothetical protein
VDVSAGRGASVTAATFPFSVSLFSIHCLHCKPAEITALSFQADRLGGLAACTGRKRTPPDLKGARPRCGISFHGLDRRVADQPRSRQLWPWLSFLYPNWPSIGRLVAQATGPRSMVGGLATDLYIIRASTGCSSATRRCCGLTNLLRPIAWWLSDEPRTLLRDEFSRLLPLWVRPVAC